MMFARDELRIEAVPGGGKVLAYVLLLAVVLIALLARAAFGQERRTQEPFDLWGTVTDVETGQPLVGAFVAFEGSEWGSVTNEDGRFRIPDVFGGPAILSAEQIGYETLSWNGDLREGEPVTLRMTPQPVILEGLQVVTDRFRSRRNATASSVQVFDRTALATTSQATALDFIAGRAGSHRVSCARTDFSSSNCLWIRGRKEAPVVWVDEHPVLGGIDYLDALRPHELHLVEVYGLGRHIRVYTEYFMEYAARTRLQPLAFVF